MPAAPCLCIGDSPDADPCPDPITAEDLLCDWCRDRGCVALRSQTQEAAF